MATYVSADTITRITSSPECRDPALVPPEPTTDELIAQVRLQLQENIDAATAGVVETDWDGNRQDYETTLAQAIQTQKDVESLLQNVPEGFRLVPVLYSRIRPQQNSTVAHEYSGHVRVRFLQFLAQKHEKELRALGIGDAGVERMKQGLDPTDDQGRYFAVSVDHIMERSGSGLSGTTKGIDPDQPAFASPKFKVNYFGNMILLPDHVHEAKNALNAAQRLTRVRPGDAKWALMLVPERNAQYAGFVCPPQRPAHRLHGLRVRTDTTGDKIERAAYRAQQAISLLRALKYNPALQKTIQSFSAIASAEQRGVLVIAREEGEQGRLCAAFKTAVNDNAAAQDQMQKAAPALREAASCLRAAFTAASAQGNTEKGRRSFDSFVRFFRGKDMRQTRDLIRNMPCRESLELDLVCQRIELRIREVHEARNHRGPRP